MRGGLLGYESARWAHVAKCSLWTSAGAQAGAGDQRWTHQQAAAVRRRLAGGGCSAPDSTTSPLQGERRSWQVQESQRSAWVAAGPAVARETAAAAGWQLLCTSGGDAAAARRAAAWG